MAAANRAYSSLKDDQKAKYQAKANECNTSKPKPSELVGSSRNSNVRDVLGKIEQWVNMCFTTNG